MSPLKKINSVETTAPFNVGNHPRDTIVTMLLVCYLDRIATNTSVYGYF